MRPADGWAWVTGASSGIGRALALKLAREGWTVAASARSDGALAALAAEAAEREAAGKQAVGRIIAAPLDVTDPRAVEAAVARLEDELGTIALAVFNAGVYPPVRAEAPDVAAFRTAFDVNLIGTAAGLAAVNPRMAARRRGQIAIVSSATGFGGMPTCAAYGASKAALINMAEALRIELHRWGVLVQVVTPGFVETPAQDDNDFPKPFMVSAETAAKRIARGLKRRAFEITFPKRFTWPLKAFYALPRALWLPLSRAQTGWAEPLAPEATPWRE